MRKLLVRLVLAVAMVLPAAVVNVAPASANDYQWSQSWCRPDVWWYSQPGRYVQYWRDDHSWSLESIFTVYADWPTHPFARRHLQVYADNGYECGRMGPPLGDIYRSGTSGWWRQTMERGALWYSELNQSWIWCPYGDAYCYYT